MKKKMKNTSKSLSILGMVKRHHHNHDRNQQVLTSRNIQVRRILAIAAALSIVIIYQTGLLTDADALTRYYNCTTRAANKNGSLSLQNADNCYDFIFKGAKGAEEELQAKTATNKQ
jgi:hypothetical protein